MKKLHFLSFIIFNAVIALGIILIYTDIDAENYRYSNLRDDSVVMFKQTGFTEADQDKISTNQAVDQVDFAETSLYYKNDHDNYFFTNDEKYQPSLYANTEGIYANITGNYLNLDVVDPDKINLVDGRMLEAENEIIIDEQFKTEIENQDFSQEELETMANGREVVGTYASNDLYSGYCNEYQVYDEEADKQVSSTECQASNAYYTSEAIAMDQDFASDVNSYNSYIISENNQWLKIINSADDKEQFDYEKSVENGVIDIVDPASDEYGDEFQQIVYIKLSNAEAKEDFIQEMKILFADSEILTDDRELISLTNFKQQMTIIVIVTLLLNILIFGPVFFQAK